MPNPKLTLPVIVVALGLGLAVVIANSKPQPQPRDTPVKPAPPVQVLEVQPQPGRIMVRSQGTVAPRRQIELVAQVGGVVTAADPAFVEGGSFAAGTHLLTIDDRDYAIALTRAQAKLADARQALATERGRARQARKEWRELGDAEANALFLRKPQLASAEAQVQAAQADVEQARLDLERTRVRAPFAGRVIDISVDLGQYVSAGSSVARIFAADAAEVPLAFSERQRALLELEQIEAEQGLPVTLHAEIAGRAESWSAVIRRTAPQIDAQTRLLHAIAEVEDPFGLQGRAGAPLLIGQFVEARVPSRQFDAIARLPAQALRPGDVLWTVDAEQRLRLLPVRLLQSEAGEVVVALESAAPLRIVTSYLARPHDGMRLAQGAVAGGGS